MHESLPEPLRQWVAEQAAKMGLPGPDSYILYGLTAIMWRSFTPLRHLGLLSPSQRHISAPTLWASPSSSAHDGYNSRGHHEPNGVCPRKFSSVELERPVRTSC